MFDVLLLSEEAQIAIFLIIAEDATKYFINKEFNKSAKNVLNYCWEYIEKKNVRGDDLYELIGAEDDNIVYLQAEAEEENDIRIWDCVIDSVVYTCRKAYEAHYEQLPQAIESADFTLYKHVIDQYIVLDSYNEEKIKKIELFFMDNYINNRINTKINISELKRLGKELLST